MGHLMTRTVMPGGSIRQIWPCRAQASGPPGAGPPRTGCEKDCTPSGLTLLPRSGSDERGREGSDRGPHLWRNLSPGLATRKTQPLSFPRALWKVLPQAGTCFPGERAVDLAPRPRVFTLGGLWPGRGPSSVRSDALHPRTMFGPTSCVPVSPCRFSLTAADSGRAVPVTLVRRLLPPGRRSSFITGWWERFRVCGN